MGRPNFIGIGAQKCASTWLYDILRDHPQARLSEQKELDFFSCQYDRGFGWYERQFPAATQGAAVGEVSPSYFHEAAVPGRVHGYMPQARIIASLRDPVQRALSHHRHAVRVGDVSPDDLRFEAALSRNPTYLEQGLYATHLERWLTRFGTDRVLILFYEDILADPAAVARRVYSFLGIDPEYRSTSLERRSNVSHVIPHPALERVRATMRGAVRRAHLGPLWETAAAVGARRLYHRLNRRPSAEVIPPAAAATLRELRRYYRDEVDRLEILTGRDLSAWREGGAGAPSQLSTTTAAYQAESA